VEVPQFADKAESQRMFVPVVIGLSERAESVKTGRSRSDGPSSSGWSVTMSWQIQKMLRSRDSSWPGRNPRAWKSLSERR
jgi:hypothetical protein